MHSQRSMYDLIKSARPQDAKDAKLLISLRELFDTHPELFPRVAAMVREYAAGNDEATSICLACQVYRWTHHVHIHNDIIPALARCLVYVYNDLDGVMEMHATDRIDRLFGVTLAAKTLPNDYGRRLLWSDSTPIAGPRPGGMRKPVDSVCEPQGELFREVA